MKRKKCIKSDCSGCRDDYYNTGESVCWSLDSATLVTRYELGWWDDPTLKRNYRKVVVPSCYRRPGTFAYVESIPRGVK